MTLCLRKTVSEQLFGPPLGVVAQGHEQSVPIFQQLARSDPFGRDDVREIPAVAAQRRGSASRARDRHQPRDGPILVEPVWSDVRSRDQEEAGRAYARVHPMALAFG